MLRLFPAALMLCLPFLSPDAAYGEETFSAELCGKDAELSLSEYLRINGAYADDPVAGRLHHRSITYEINTHSLDSLYRGLRRYRDQRTAALITYFRDDSPGFRGDGCVWLVSARGIEAYERVFASAEEVRAAVRATLEAIGADGSIADRAPVLRKQIETAGSAPIERSEETSEDVDDGALSSPKPVEEAASALTDILFPGAVKDRIDIFEAVIVVPHEALFGFPFSLASISEERLLIDGHSLQLAPHVAEIGLGAGLHRDADSNLAHMTVEQRREALRRAVLIGNPVYDDPEYFMPDLPGAAHEVLEISEKFGVTPLTGAEATLSATIEAINSAVPRYLHLASHALADLDSVPANKSFVALANGERLDAASLAEVRLENGAIVVLSACQTGLGASRPGGVIGLPRVFQNIGAQYVLMSHWNVGDEATYFMMTEFIDALTATGRVAQSHAQAVRKTRERYPDPRLWASFSVFGVGPN